MRALLLSVICAAACATKFDPPSRLEGMRVLDVSVDASYAPPGATVSMQMLAVDQQARPISVAWFAGCVNPDGDQANGCLDELNAYIATLTNDQLNGTAAADTRLGHGTSFAYALPPDIITSRPPPVDNSTPYGLAYVYFAACAGDLQVADPPILGFAVTCSDPSADSFVTGYTPIYAYDALTNSAPQISDVQIDATVKACTKKKIDQCPDNHVSVVVDPSQSEPDVEAPHEILWAAFFATVGQFLEDTQEISDTDGVIRSLKDSRGEWHIEPGYTGPATIYVVLYDSRGGSSWTSRDVVVE